MPHLDDGMIHELLDGEIPSSELAPITAHLASCASCRARLAAARAFMAEADALIETLDLPHVEPVPMIAPARPARRWVGPVAWAASLLIAAAGGYAMRNPVQLLPSPSPLSVDAPIRAGDVAATPPTATPPKKSTLPLPPSMRSSEPTAKAAAPAASSSSLALAEPTVTSEGARERVEPAAPPPTTAAAPMALGSAGGAVRDAISGNALRRSDGDRGLMPRENLSGKQLSDNFTSRVDTIGLPDALRLLRGRIRLIDGLVPRRLEAKGIEVRVVYPLSDGELVLAQRLVAGSISWRLLAPTGFPADSLDQLRALVHE